MSLKKLLNSNITKSFLFVAFIIITIILYKSHENCECKERISYKNVHINNGISLDSLYSPPKITEINSINSSWKNFKIGTDSTEIVIDGLNSNQRKLLITKQYVNGQKHYGAIIFPDNYIETKKYPLLVFASGLNQMQPSVNLNMRPDIKKFFSDLNNYFIIIPSYRGQALLAKRKSYCSDGFFGDAFDGATDDALHFLEFTKTNFPNVDRKKIAVYGESRGGTVALLMGIRDRSINAVISVAGPTDFFSKEVYKRYGLQYKYQFLSKKKPLTKLREKIIKSSPIYFIESYQNNLLLIHGENDKIVPISNARKLIKRLKEKENLDTLINNGGHTNNQLDKVLIWLNNKNI